MLSESGDYSKPSPFDLKRFEKSLPKSLRESLRKVPSKSPFEKSLRFVPPALASLVPPAPPRRERPCVVVDLARCASALARPIGGLVVGVAPVVPV
eukprot:scaffold61598_cov63-Phaeocystis_antarctica.AAC.1